MDGKSRLTLLLDDTLVNKSERQVEGAGFFHDAVASTAVAHTVSANPQRGPVEAQRGA
jgi:hypothetical protein